MKISVLCSGQSHPIMPRLAAWVSRHGTVHEIDLIGEKSGLSGGDLLFLVSCHEIITDADRAKYKSTLVIHASDLPEGRGWSPHVWAVVGGAQELVLSLIEAEDKVDSGKIWKKIRIEIQPHQLWDEINQLLFDAEIELMDYAVAHCETVVAVPQDAEIAPTYHRRRNAEDSRIDPHRSIAEQFDLLRICDPLRYPAFFDHFGKRYKIILEKLDER